MNACLKLAKPFVTHDHKNNYSLNPDIKFRVISQSLCKNTSESTLIHFRDIKTSEETQCLAVNIYHDKDLMAAFSPKDQLMIAFIAGEDSEKRGHNAYLI